MPRSSSVLDKGTPPKFCWRLGEPVSLGLTRKKWRSVKGKWMNKKEADASFFSGLVFSSSEQTLQRLLRTHFVNILLCLHRGDWKRFIRPWNKQIDQEIHICQLFQTKLSRLKNWQIFVQITKIWIVCLVPHVTVEKNWVRRVAVKLRVYHKALSTWSRCHVSQLSECIRLFKILNVPLQTNLLLTGKQRMMPLVLK